MFSFVGYVCLILLEAISLGTSVLRQFGGATAVLRDWNSGCGPDRQSLGRAHVRFFDMPRGSATSCLIRPLSPRGQQAVRLLALPTTVNRAAPSMPNC